jgi:hypothetical protein
VGTGTELIALPKELRIERRISNAARGAAVSWLPVALLAPFAFMAEVVPAAIGILVVVGFTIREFRRARADVLPHLELADSGDIEEASVQVAEMAKRERDWRRKSFLIGVLAHLELRAGNRSNAEALARESLRHPQAGQPVLERSLQGNLAMILMLTGEEEEALELLPISPTPDPVTDTNRLVIWGRAGRWKEVAEYQYLRMPQMQGLRHNNRVMALLKALALEQTKGGALKLQRYLDEARPRLDGEYAYLSEGWPELEAFIEEHAELKAKRSILRREA